MQPNSANNFFGVKVSKAGIPVNQASDKQLVYKDDFSTKTYYDTANPRMVEGLLPDGTYGLWVSKPGFDVTTASPSQLVFNSNQNIFKIVVSDTATVPGFNQAANTLVWSSLVIPHGLSYIPVLNAYALVDQFYNFDYPVLNLQLVRSYVALPYNAATGALLNSNISRYEITASVDATNVYIGWFYSTSSGGSGYNFPPVPIRYDLLQESAN